MWPKLSLQQYKPLNMKIYSDNMNFNHVFDFPIMFV